MLPDELGLLVFSNLPWDSLVQCSLVCKRWQILSEDPTLWRKLCAERHWAWRDRRQDTYDEDFLDSAYGNSDDEGMGDEEDEEDETVEHMLYYDSDRVSMDVDTPLQQTFLQAEPHTHHEDPNYKLLFRTHTMLKSRFKSSLYSLSTLQTSVSSNGHSNTIYCLQLYTYPDTGKQVLFTGSKDRTVREWDLGTGAVTRVFEKVHRGSVLSICARNGLLVSGGSDCTVVVWDLATGVLVAPIRNHTDSVLCVRLDDKRLVTCSKGQCSYSPWTVNLLIQFTSQIAPSARISFLISGPSMFSQDIALPSMQCLYRTHSSSLRRVTAL